MGSPDAMKQVNEIRYYSASAWNNYQLQTETQVFTDFTLYSSCPVIGKAPFDSPPKTKKKQKEKHRTQSQSA